MEEMTTEKAIEVLQSHKSHWERLLREKICDKTEGTDFINAVDMSINALQDSDFLTFLMNNISKNELESYFSMYRAINKIGMEE